jgi:photosystem II protein
VVRPVASGGGKTDLNKVGLNSIPEGVVKNNLKGIAPQMEKKGWVDAQGRKGKVCIGWQQQQNWRGCGCMLSAML